jgi:hypothetical protein
MRLAARLDLETPFLWVTGVMLSLGTVYAIEQRPTLLRALAALVVTCLLVALTAVRPRAAIVVLFAFLPLLGLVRRLLISTAGWSTHDPLLLVAPLFLALLLVRMFVLEHRPIAPDRTSKLVLAFLAVAALESANTGSGGLAAGAGGFLFVAAPIAWFFVGRELIDRSTMTALLGLTVALAAVAAVYGLLQSWHGMPSWDAAWISQGGYSALNVDGTIRAFGTFASSAEYALYLGMALAVAVALLLHGRILLVGALPLLAVAAFLDGSRGVVVTACFAAFAMAGLRTGRGSFAVPIVVAGVAGAIFALHTYGTALTSSTAAATNPIVAHQVDALTNPLDPQQSTALLHLRGLTHGVEDGVRHPLGYGTAAVSLGGSRFGGTARTTEMDVSNAFVSLGVTGGVLFLLIALTTFRRSVRRYLRGRDPLVLGILGGLMVTFGQWLNGGLYALTPLIWVLIGWVTATGATDDA